MLANKVGEDYWVKVASFNLDEPSYRTYEHWSGKIMGNQNIAWSEFSALMERHYQKKRDPSLAQIELRAYKWNKSKPFTVFAMELFDTIRMAFLTVGTAELETMGSSILCQKVPTHWLDRLDALHQKDLGCATFSHDRDQCVAWEASEAVKAERKLLEKEFEDSILEKRDRGKKPAREEFDNRGRGRNQGAPVQIASAGDETPSAFQGYQPRGGGQ